MIKDFDCVEMKRRIQAELYEQIKNLSDKERDERTRRAVETGPFADWWKRLKSVNDARAREARQRRTG